MTKGLIQILPASLASVLLVACGGGGGGSAGTIQKCSSYPELNNPNSNCPAWHDEQTLAEAGATARSIDSPAISIDEDGNISAIFRLEMDNGAQEGFKDITYEYDNAQWSEPPPNLFLDNVLPSVATFIDEGVRTFAFTSGSSSTDTVTVQQGAFNMSGTELISSTYTDDVQLFGSTVVDYGSEEHPVYAYIVQSNSNYDVCLTYKPNSSASYQDRCSDIDPSVELNASAQQFSSLSLSAEFSSNTLKAGLVFGENLSYTDGSTVTLDRIVAANISANASGITSHVSKVIAQDTTGTNQYANPQVELASGSAALFVTFDELTNDQVGLFILDENLDRAHPATLASSIINGGLTFDTARNARLVKALDGDMVWAFFATKDGNERPIIRRINFSGADQAGYQLDDAQVLQAGLVGSAGYTQHALDMAFAGNGNMAIAYKESLCEDADNVGAGSCSQYTSRVRVAYFRVQTGLFDQSTNSIVSQQSFENESAIVDIPTDNQALAIDVNSGQGQAAIIFQERRAPQSGSGPAENTVRVLRLD
ncbi:MAG: hypothetical protein MK096_09850 [Oleiphilaceae bacterium]|nr:hypothetical protein [Oleiphilaceae bacterium]